MMVLRLGFASLLIVIVMLSLASAEAINSGENYDFINLLKDLTIITAFILSLYNTYSQHKQQRNAVPIIDVETSDHLEGQTGKENSLQIGLYAVNNGDSAVTISYIGYQFLEQSKKIFLVSHRYGLPKRLEPGNYYSQWIYLKDLEESFASNNIPNDATLFFFLEDGHKRMFRSATPFKKSFLSRSPS